MLCEQILGTLSDEQFKNLKVDYVDIERHLEFPEPNLKSELSGDELVITAERFARCTDCR